MCCVPLLAAAIAAVAGWTVGDAAAIDAAAASGRCCSPLGLVVEVNVVHLIGDLLCLQGQQHTVTEGACTAPVNGLTIVVKVVH
jgi:hypothetical protein